MEYGSARKRDRSRCLSQVAHRPVKAWTAQDARTAAKSIGFTLQRSCLMYLRARQATNEPTEPLSNRI